ncbi:MAG: hypothetical protein V4537_13325 [Pseudomonadota bacterium]
MARESAYVRSLAQKPTAMCGYSHDREAAFVVSTKKTSIYQYLVLQRRQVRIPGENAIALSAKVSGKDADDVNVVTRGWS